MHAECGFEVADKRVHRGDAERIAADEQRVERQRKAQCGVGDPARGMGMDRAVRAIPGKFRKHLDEVPKPMHRPAAQILEPENIACPGILEEPVEALKVRRGQPRRFGPHRFDARAHREMATVGETYLVEGVDRAQVDVPVEIAPGGGPEVAQDLGDSDDGRPKVEAVALVGDRRAAATRPVKPVDDRDTPTLCAKTHRRSQAAEAGPDHQGLALGRRLFIAHTADDKVSIQIYNSVDTAAKQPLLGPKFFAKVSA
jgi:hypothetical protein